jgi:hypothetical protein
MFFPPPPRNCPDVICQSLFFFLFILCDEFDDRVLAIFIFFIYFFFFCVCSGAGPIPMKKKQPGSYYETDLDSMVTLDTSREHAYQQQGNPYGHARRASAGNGVPFPNGPASYADPYGQQPTNVREH